MRRAAVWTAHLSGRSGQQRHHGGNQRVTDNIIGCEADDRDAVQVLKASNNLGKAREFGQQIGLIRITGHHHGGMQPRRGGLFGMKRDQDRGRDPWARGGRDARGPLLWQETLLRPAVGPQRPGIAGRAGWKKAFPAVAMTFSLDGTMPFAQQFESRGGASGRAVREAEFKGMSAVTTRGVTEDEAGLRLDRWFRRHFPDLGHGRLERLLRTGQVRVDGRRVKAGDRVEPGQVVRIPPLTASGAESGSGGGERSRPPVSRNDAEALQARVISRDDDVLVIDKPAGLAVQGGTNTSRHLDGLLDVLRFDALERPRLVHRLDKDTSGVLVLARTAFAAGRLTEAFRGREARKLYAAVTVGVPDPPGGRIDLPLAKEAGVHGERVAVAGEDGLKASTLYQVLDTVGDQAAYLHLSPLTGRTHQLRVHLAALGTPILGDRKYGGTGAALPGMDEVPQLHLHARRLLLPHPRRGVVDVAAPLPPHMVATCTWLGIDPPPASGPFPGEV